MAIVTGGSSGIGRAAALEFAKAGANVAIAARRVQEGEETVRQAQEAGGNAIFVQTDVTKAEDVKALVDKTLQTYNRLDYAFNNAGFGKTVRLVEQSESNWDWEIDVNLKAVWLSLKHQIPAMLQTGGGAMRNWSAWSC